MSEKTVKGRINCPYCGYAEGMRITVDRNGAPFGFCDANCDGQLRVGGRQKRIDGFFALHPNIAKAFRPEAEQPPVKEMPTAVAPTEKAKEAKGFTLFN